MHEQPNNERQIQVVAAAPGTIRARNGALSRSQHPGARANTAQKSIRDIRQKLLDEDERPPELRYELILMFVRNELAAQWTILVLAFIFSLASMFWAPPMQAMTWLIVVVAAKICLLEVCRHFKGQDPETVDLDVWTRRLIIAEAICGISWAGFALVGAGNNVTGDQGYIFSSHVFIFASLIVVLAIRMTFASTMLPLLYVGTIPMTLAVVTHLVLQGDFFYFALASLAVGVHIYFIFLAKGLQTTAVSMLNFRLQKDLLIAELAESKSISDEARRRAEDANLAKSRFLATMSHELRTPLNAVLGFSEVMKAEILGPLENETYKEYAENIHTSGSHLLNLINEILDLSRIEAGKYELNEKSILLGDIIDDSLSLLKLRAETKGVRLNNRCTPGLPALWADERAIRQICLNLLSNAIKFTPRGGEIDLVAANTTDGGQLLSVTDTGPGIPQDEIPKVLESFGQGSLAHQTAEGGTGLGLSIVQSLIGLHGGKFDLISELRKGTCATVHFPASRVIGNELEPPEAQRIQVNTPARARLSSHKRPARLIRSSQSQKKLEAAIS
ncbi:MAG: HAMP domain-containing sensor histidine kinase [Pseudomonadota bacterium]